MSLSELWRCIFVAWVVAVGRCGGVMFRKQNNGGPSSSHSLCPASTDSANSQHNVIQADDADDSTFEQTPIFRGGQSNIPQDKANSQCNAIKANSAKKSNFRQRPIADNVPHGTPWDLLCYGILIALVQPGTLWALLCCVILIALIVRLSWRKIARLLGFQHPKDR